MFVESEAATPHVRRGFCFCPFVPGGLWRWDIHSSILCTVTGHCTAVGIFTEIYHIVSNVFFQCFFFPHHIWLNGVCCAQQRFSIRLIKWACVTECCIYWPVCYLQGRRGALKKSYKKQKWTPRATPPTKFMWSPNWCGFAPVMVPILQLWGEPGLWPPQCRLISLRVQWSWAMNQQSNRKGKGDGSVPSGSQVVHSASAVSAGTPTDKHLEYMNRSDFWVMTFTSPSFWVFSTTKQDRRHKMFTDKIPTSSHLLYKRAAVLRIKNTWGWLTSLLSINI